MPGATYASFYVDRFPTFFNIDVEVIMFPRAIRVSLAQGRFPLIKWTFGLQKVAMAFVDREANFILETPPTAEAET